MANGNFGGGDGTEISPFLIEDVEDLVQVFYKNRENSNYHYKQTKSIDLLGVNWNPIGDTSQGPPFMGVFDGDNNVIKNLKVASDSSYVGLFGLCVSAELKNINIINAEVVSLNGFYASLLSPYLDGASVMYNCQVQGTVIGDFSGSNIAGLTVASSSISTIEKCSAEVKLIGHNVSGAVVYPKGTISNCYVVGSIEGISVNGESKLQASTFAHSCSSTCTIKKSYAVVTMNNANSRNTNMGLFALPENSSDTPTIHSCYSDITIGVANDIWVADVPYYTSEQLYYVRGTDGGLYKLLKTQDDKDYDTSGFPPFYDAQPISGSRYSEFWESVTPSTDENARTTEQMKIKETFVDWDFDKVWLIDEGKSYPTLRRPPRKITCKRVPLNNYRR